MSAVDRNPCPALPHPPEHVKAGVCQLCHRNVVTRAGLATRKAARSDDQMLCARKEKLTMDTEGNLYANEEGRKRIDELLEAKLRDATDDLKKVRDLKDAPKDGIRIEKAAVRAVLGDIGGTVACQRCGGYSEDSANCEGMAEGHGGPCEPPKPAACDVEALAKVITYVLEMRSALADDPQLRKVAQDIAETTLSHVGAELAKAKKGGEKR